MKIILFLLVAMTANAKTTTVSTCQFNTETNKFFVLSDFPKDQRMVEYQKYMKDMQANPGKYIGKPCPDPATEKPVGAEVDPDGAGTK